MSLETLERVFRNILETAQPFQATAYRAVQDKYRQTLLSGVGSIRVGGRYNPKGVFEALYLAESPEIALGEVGFSRSSGGKFEAQPLAPYLLLSVQVQLQRAIRLEDWLVDLGVNLEDLLAPWRHLQNEGKLPITQAIGTAALRASLEGLIVPSRISTAARNLVVFPNNLQPNSSVEVFDLEGNIKATLSKFSATVEAAVNVLKQQTLIASYEQFTNDYAASKDMQKEAEDWFELDDKLRIHLGL